MSRTAGIVVFAVAIFAAATLAALHLVYGWRPAPRVCGDRSDEIGTRGLVCVLPMDHVGDHGGFEVDRDAWPEGVGWTW